MPTIISMLALTAAMTLGASAGEPTKSRANMMGDAVLPAETSVAVLPT